MTAPARCTRSGRRSPRSIVLALFLVLATALTGCVSIPDDSAPQPIEAFDRKDQFNGVPLPRRADDPETLARNFLRAMADPATGHLAARKYLTGGASERWDDQGDMTIVDNVGVVVDERTESAVRLRVTADKIGTLSPAGQLLPASGTYVLPLSLARVNGAWRINGDLPSGSITDGTQFVTAYRQVNLFFPDRTMGRLVTDPRWVFGAVPEAEDLVSRILRGPSPDLAGAIGAGAEKGASLTSPVSSDGRTITIDLSNVTDTDTGNRTALAAQLVWTLDNAGISGTYVINADGAPLVADQDSGWRTADVRSFEPDPDSDGQATLHLVRDGALVRSTGQQFVPVPGRLGASRDVRAAAVTGNMRRAAAVLGLDERQILVEGPYGTDGEEILAGREISSVSYGTDGTTGYALVDGKPMQWSRDGQGKARAVVMDTRAVTAAVPGPITAISVSPDGVRIALIVAGRPFIAVVSTNDRGVPSLTGVRPAAYDISTQALDISWATSSVMYLIRSGDDPPVLRLLLAGGPSVEMVGGNLKPPVAAISSSPRTVFVADTQGVQQLGTASGRPDQYWTSVGSAIPSGSLPVVPEG